MIILVGVDYHNMAVNDRELFSLTPERIPKVYQEVKKKFPQTIFLSTCNRMEVYFLGNKKDYKIMIDWLVSYFIPENKVPEIVVGLKEKFYHYRGNGAVRHLLEVSAGLHSMVVGENQILHQVKKAYQDACNYFDLNADFHKLFQTALALGKKVRTQTDISKGGMSLGSVSVDIIKKFYEKDSQFSVGLIGAGEIAEEVLKSLIHHGQVKVLICNRDSNRAQKLIDHYRNYFEAKYIPFVRRYEMVAFSDVTVVSTNAPEYVLSKVELEKSLDKRYRFSFLIDLSVPRNIDPDIAELYDFVVYTLDDLDKIIAENYSQRTSQIDSCRNLIEEQLQCFQEWMIKHKFFSLKKEWKSLLVDVNKEQRENQQEIIPVEKLEIFFEQLYKQIISQSDVETWDLLKPEPGIEQKDFLKKTLSTIPLPGKMKI